MYHMTTVSIRDLRYDFQKVEALLRQGEEIQITKHRKVIARLIPENAAYPALPDFLGRIKDIYGDKEFEVSGADLISADRERNL
jgi:antitoxin (DNA-binding transcriptional repressor) of toxin-antitoxin stability system